MPITMQIPWSVAMSPVGPSIEYAVDYKFNSEVNVKDNTRTIRVAGPGEAFGVAVVDNALESMYDMVAQSMTSHGLKVLKVDTSGRVLAEWEQVENVGQAMHIQLRSTKFSAVWRAYDVEFDDAEAAMTAVSTISASFDPASATYQLEVLVVMFNKLFEEMYALACDSQKA